MAASTAGATRGSDGTDLVMGIGDGWLSTLLNMNRLALISVFFQHSLRLKGKNLTLFFEALRFARAAKHFPILFGDFNFGPEELQRALDLQSMRLAIAVPSNTDVTCMVGGGTLSSFAVVAAEIVNLVTNCRAVAVPWGTHKGLAFKVLAARTAPLYRALQRPLRFASYALSVDPEEWEEARVESSAALDRCGGIPGSHLGADNSIDGFPGEDGVTVHLC